jgi:SAM-dependent methyltransferase
MGMNMKQNRNLEYFYPEIGAGGFTRIDGTVAFYVRLNSLLRPEMTVLDLGAGRGAELNNDPSHYRRTLSTLRGRVKLLVGVDVDDAVLENEFLDEAIVNPINSPLPFPDNTFDVIYSDWVLEHVANPSEFSEQVLRVLKPGGWFCARTPNRWGFNGLATNTLPNNSHSRILKYLQPTRNSRDVFPTTYKLNSMSRLARYFGSDCWDNYSYFYNPEPAYVQGSRLLMRAVMLFNRLTPSRFANDLHVFLRKRGNPE